MMKRIEIALLLLIVAALLQGCEQIIDLNTIKPDPKLVLNSVVKAGEPVSVDLSRTWFYTDEKPNIAIPDAEVKLYVNDLFHEQLSFTPAADETGQGLYSSTYTPSAGDRIRLTASAAGYPEVTASTELPSPMPITDCRLTAERRAITEHYDTLSIYNVDYTLELTINDDPAADNYYLISGEELRYDSYSGYDYGSDAEQGKDTAYWISSYLRFSEVPLFKNEVTAFDYIFGSGGSRSDYWGAFSDELIDGDSYLLQLPIGRYSYILVLDEEQTIINPRKFRIHLQAISKDYYNYLKTLQELTSGSFTGDLASAGFAEPIRLISNVEGGAGVLGSATDSFYEWDEREIITFD